MKHTIPLLVKIHRTIRGEDYTRQCPLIGRDNRVERLHTLSYALYLALQRDRLARKAVIPATITAKLTTALRGANAMHLLHTTRRVLERGVTSLLKLRRLSWVLHDRRAAAIYAVHVRRQINGS